MSLRLLSFIFALFALVFAQGDDTVSLTTPEQDFTRFATFDFFWKGEAGHNLNNITLELVQGSAEDNGNSVMDIIVTNISSVDKTSVLYTIHPGVPVGTYHARMNGTIYNGNTILPSGSAFSTLSNTFSISDSNVPCSAGTFTPITGLNDPAYHPLRYSTPVGGDVRTQNSVTGPFSSLSFGFERIDSHFTIPFRVATTMEIINTITGFNAGVQSSIFGFSMSYTTSNITLNPGSWKIRTNFTIFKPAPYPGVFSLESEEFFIMADVNSQPTCTSPSSSGGSSSGGGSSTDSTQTTPAATSTGSGPKQSNEPSPPAASGANPFQTPSSSPNSAAFMKDGKSQSGWMRALLCAILFITIGQL
ncbi:hypothetical protein C8J57DRAFT_1329355 [Mycena rebaudengoi]|nr:hypothetical protein C8J57DRAFT_1329355 [Mycena rebaudengoi]